MRRFALAAAVPAIVWFPPVSCYARAQALDGPTAEELIETARESYRPPGLRAQCDPGNAGEIVVCGRDPDKYRVESSREEAIANDDPNDDPSDEGMPRAPDPFQRKPCVPSLLSFCGGVGPPRPQPLLIDLAALPEALTPEEAARVVRAEDTLEEP